MIQERPDPSATAIFSRVDLNSESEEPRQVSLSSDALEAIKRLPKGSALLVVHTGNPGARFLLDAERVTVGRKPSSDIFFDDVTVSRKHAEFFRTDSGYGVRDSGSLNGTYVNRERVEKVELQSGDEVQIGKYRMSYHAGSAN